MIYTSHSNYRFKHSCTNKIRPFLWLNTSKAISGLRELGISIYIRYIFENTPSDLEIGWFNSRPQEWITANDIPSKKMESEAKHTFSSTCILTSQELSIKKATLSKITSQTPSANRNSIKSYHAQEGFFLRGARLWPASIWHGTELALAPSQSQAWLTDLRPAFCCQHPWSQG